MTGISQTIISGSDISVGKESSCSGVWRSIDLFTSLHPTLDLESCSASYILRNMNHSLNVKWETVQEDAIRKKSRI